MSRFYNREPWNLIVGFGFVLFLALLILAPLVALTSPWVLVLPFLLCAFFFAKAPLVRAVNLRRKGYFGGRRKGDVWVYEERSGRQTLSLSLRVENTEPGHYELFVPNDAEWRASVPPWAQHRRQEIVQRISEEWKPIDVHLPAERV